MPSNHLILCWSPPPHASNLASIRVFSNESALHIMWPKYWGFSLSISPSSEYSGLISFRVNRWYNMGLGQLVHLGWGALALTTLACGLSPRGPSGGPSGILQVQMIQDKGSSVSASLARSSGSPEPNWWHSPWLAWQSCLEIGLFSRVLEEVPWPSYKDHRRDFP